MKNGFILIIPNGQNHGSQPTIRFNAEEEYSRAKDFVLHLVGPGGCAVLHLASK